RVRLRVFFSSSRRHTRCLSDWSSDVCSSDLYNQSWKDAWDAIPDERGDQARLPLALCELQGYAYDAKLRLAQIYEALDRDEEARSEERRVGKEWRARGAPDQDANNERWQHRG